MLFAVVKIRKIEYAYSLELSHVVLDVIASGTAVEELISHIYCCPFGISYMTVLCAIHKWNDGFAEENMVTCLIKTPKTLLPATGKLILLATRELSGNVCFSFASEYTNMSPIHLISVGMVL